MSTECFGIAKSMDFPGIDCFVAVPDLGFPDICCLGKDSRGIGYFAVAMGMDSLETGCLDKDSLGIDCFVDAVGLSFPEIDYFVFVRDLHSLDICYLDKDFLEIGYVVAVDLNSPETDCLDEDSLGIDCLGKLRVVDSNRPFGSLNLDMLVAVLDTDID